MDTFRQELIIRMASDQSQMTDEVFKDNAEWLKAQLEVHKFPTIKRTCIQAAQAGWLIAQHADHDPEFQARYLSLLREHKDDIMPEWIAYLTDRIEVRESGKQVFGTQMRRGKSGEFELVPVDISKAVDALREAFGMSTLAQYMEQHRAMHGQ